MSRSTPRPEIPVWLQFWIPILKSAGSILRGSSLLTGPVLISLVGIPCSVDGQPERAWGETESRVACLIEASAYHDAKVPESVPLRARLRVHVDLARQELAYTSERPEPRAGGVPRRRGLGRRRAPRRCEAGEPSQLELACVLPKPCHPMKCIPPHHCQDVAPHGSSSSPASL